MHTFYIYGVQLWQLLQIRLHMLPSLSFPTVDYGWALEDGKLVPVQSTQSAWPQTNYASRCMWLHQRMQQKLFLCIEERGLLHWMSLPGIRHQV